MSIIKITSSTLPKLHHSNIIFSINRLISSTKSLNNEYPIPQDPNNRVRDTMAKIIKEENVWTKKGSNRLDTEQINRIQDRTIDYCFNKSKDIPRLRRCIEKAEKDAYVSIKNPEVRRNVIKTLRDSRNVR